MELFFAQCGAFWGNNMPILLSVAFAGLIGSASHCSVMCSPLVGAQMLELKEVKCSQWYMSIYHVGRISSYVLLGIVATLAGGWLFAGHLSQLANVVMLAAGLMFIVSALKPLQTHACPAHKFSKLQRAINMVPSQYAIYYLRGLLMGFMPCGMVVAALMLVSTFHSPIMAALAMALFGLGTLPLLQLAGFGALRLSHHYPNGTRIAGRGVMALNGCFLCAIGMNLVTMT